MDDVKNMAPEDIKAALKDAGITASGIARDLNCSPTHVLRIINGGAVSDRVRRHIAKCIRVSVEQIWPETYLNGGPREPGRPMSRGLYDHQAA